MRFRDLRFPCDIDVTVACAGVARRVRLANVSRTGARVVGLGDVPCGAPALLSALEGRHAAAVTWCDGRQAGLRFEPPLTPAQLDALRGVRGRPGAWGPAPRPFRELS